MQFRLRQRVPQVRGEQLDVVLVGRRELLTPFLVQRLQHGNDASVHVTDGGTAAMGGRVCGGGRVGLCVGWEHACGGECMCVGVGVHLGV